MEPLLADTPYPPDHIMSVHWIKKFATCLGFFVNQLFITLGDLLTTLTSQLIRNHTHSVTHPHRGARFVMRHAIYEWASREPEEDAV